MKRTAFLLVGVAGCFCLASPAWAQSDGAPSRGPAESDAQPSTAAAAPKQYSGDIIVTANKRSESTLNVAGSVQVMSAEDLDKIAASRLADYAPFIPGLQIQPSLNTGQQTIILRGIAPQQAAPTTSTYIDDVAVGGTSNEGSGATGLADIDPSELERVEVLNGPQGTLYGASSLGGVVKFVTRKPNLREIEGSVGVDGFTVDNGNIGTDLRARVSVPLITDKVAIAVSGHYRKDPGYLDDTGLLGKNSNDGTSYGFRGTLLIQPDDSWQIRLMGLFNRQQSDSTNSIIIDPVTRQPLYGKYGQHHTALASGSNQVALFSATISHEFGDGGPSFTSVTSYSKSKQALASDPYNFFSGNFGLPIPTAVSYSEYPVNQWTQEVRLSSNDTGSFRWVLGGYYQRERGFPTNKYYGTNPDGSIRILPSPYDPLYTVIRDYSLRELAGFGNVSYYFLPNLSVTLGYRYSDIRQHNTGVNLGYFANPKAPTVGVTKDFRAQEDKSTYLATLSFNPTPNTELYARAASGYRPGGSRSRPVGVDPATFPLEYNSDSIWNYEVGAKGHWPSAHMNASLAAFWIDWSDIQTNFILGNSSFNVVGNGGKARSRGVEASLGFEPLHGLNIHGDVTYTDAHFLDANKANGILADQFLPKVARWTGALGVDYSAPLSSDWNGIVGGDFQFRTNTITIQRYRQDGYGTFGLRVGAERGNFSATIYARNLFNQYRYISTIGTVAGTIVPFEAVTLQPRVIGISFSKNF